MTIIEKIKQSVEGATGMPFLFHAAGEINELIARCGELPIAYSFLIDSGTIDDVNGRYHERVTIAVMFCDKTEFDFNALENEQIIDRMKVKAYKWMHSLRMSNALRVISVNNTQRLYDNTTDILTGFALNITLEDITGVGECELPDVVFEIKENGEYPVVGIDKVFVNVLPKSTDIVITENGEYYPNDYDVDAFSKVGVDVKPKLEEITATDNGTYTPSEGFDGFGKVNVDLKGVFDVSKFFGYAIPQDPVYNTDSSRTKLSIIIDGDFLVIPNCSYGLEISDEFDFNRITKAQRLFYSTIFRKGINYSFDKIKFDSINEFYQVFYTANQTDGAIIDLTTWDFTNTALSNGYLIRQMFGTSIKDIVGYRTIDDIINNNICVLKGLRSNPFIQVANNLNRESLRAIINGLADMSEYSPQTLQLHANVKAKLTEEDIAIATNKNWTIA